MEDKRKIKLLEVPVNVDIDTLDKAIVKAKELVELLREANELTNSLSIKQKLNT